MTGLRLLELGIEKAESTTNPLLDASGQFVNPEEAVRNFSTLWKQWDLVNKFFDKLPTIIIAGDCNAVARRSDYELCCGKKNIDNYSRNSAEHSVSFAHNGAVGSFAVFNKQPNKLLEHLQNLTIAAHACGAQACKINN